jgi:stalled ribosome rescue protein Dom34
MIEGRVSMKRNMGVWIDHRKAVIVRMTDHAEEIQTILSDMEKHVRHPRGKPEDQEEHRYTNHLHEYYAKVIVSLHDADSILILGPGEAKGELKTLLENEALGGRIAGIGTVDKMTDPQLAAEIRKYFSGKLENTQQI